MIIDLDTLSSPALSHRPQHNSNQFAAVLAQSTALSPLFSPWPSGDQNIRSTPAMVNTALNARPATSNRREGRHARG